jgi:hypothetical protein
VRYAALRATSEAVNRLSYNFVSMLESLSDASIRSIEAQRSAMQIACPHPLVAARARLKPRNRSVAGDGDPAHRRAAHANELERTVAEAAKLHPDLTHSCRWSTSIGSSWPA